MNAIKACISGCFQPVKEPNGLSEEFSASTSLLPPSEEFDPKNIPSENWGPIFDHMFEEVKKGRWIEKYQGKVRVIRPHRPNEAFNEKILTDDQWKEILKYMYNMVLSQQEMTSGN